MTELVEDSVNGLRFTPGEARSIYDVAQRRLRKLGGRK